MRTFERRIQLRSSRVNHSSTGWVIFFPRWSQPKDLEISATWEWNESFYCVKNGKQLLERQSFIVFRSKTLHKSCKGRR